MSRDGSITLTWADGDYVFKLGWSELAKLQEAADAGPYVILNRLVDGSWRVADISATIRLGLIGGGMSPTDALKKVREYVEDRPPIESLMIAQAVLSAAIVGAPDEDVSKKKQADPKKESDLTTSLTGNSASA